MKKVVKALYPTMPANVTGGQKYEHQLWNLIGDIPGVDLQIVPMLNNRSILSKVIAPLKALFFYSKIKDADLIFFNSTSYFYFLPLSLLARLLKKKTLVIHHHFAYTEMSGLKRKIVKFFEAAYLKSSALRITPSPYVLQLINDKHLGETLLWQIPFDLPKPIPSSPAAPGQLLFMGTIEPRKGLSYLMQALLILKNKNIDASLRIAGKTVDQDYYNSLRQFISQHNLNVEFLGFISAEQKHNELRKADIFVFPSLLEGYGMVLPEAQAYGLPLVAFNNSAMPLTVKDGVNGFLCKNMDSNDMAQKLARIITNRQLRRKLSEGSLKLAQNVFTFNNFKSRVVADMSNLLNLTPPSFQQTE